MAADNIDGMGDGLERIATIASQLHARNRAYGPAREKKLPPLIAMTDRRRGADPFGLAARLRPGDALLLRDYDWAERAAAALALAPQCSARRIALIVAGNLDLAIAARADGVHLPEAMVWEHGALLAARAHNAGLRVTAAAHGLPALRRAAMAGADAALLSPVFATHTHPEARPLGPGWFSWLVREAPLPVYALGGITAATAKGVSASGAIGLAGIGFTRTGPGMGARQAAQNGESRKEKGRPEGRPSGSL